ncbi:hypothetical protein [Sphingomonas flavalba]|uniref:hypothetical protein n=1 Tax=Sphingomonas flavalba TaxID=2559804 RepID=UPI00109DAD22|nr:hypothetical protein [Sphingomonas flavalba]
MTGAGHPLRFLAAITVGWVAARAVMLWPAPAALPTPAAPPPLLFAPLIAWSEASLPARAVRQLTIRLDPAPPVTPERATVPAAEIAAGASAPPAMSAPGPSPSDPPPVLARGDPIGVAPHAGRRLTVSVWALLRGKGAASLAGGGQLGGSQAGLRAGYLIAPAARVALFGRLAAPLAAPGGREAAIGLEWQPLAGLPVRLAAERRLALDGGRDAYALGIAGGIAPVALGGRVVLDGYGQAGIVGWKRRAGYADGALRVERPVATAGPVRIAAGAGAWGGIQPGAGRIDIGPQLVARVPAAGTTLRLAADWRQRVAGNARPGSGATLSLGADF